MNERAQVKRLIAVSCVFTDPMVEMSFGEWMEGTQADGEYWHHLYRCWDRSCSLGWAKYLWSLTA